MLSPTTPPFDPDKKKNQHFVPQLWQRRFADASNSVYGRYREGADPIRIRTPRLAGKARKVSVANTMAEDWTYTVFDKWWRPSNAVEDALSKKEGLVACVFDQVVDPKVVVTPQIVQELCKAFGLAACRTPEVMRRGHRRAKEMAYALAGVRSHSDNATFLADIRNRFGVAFLDADYELILTRTDEELQVEAELMAQLSPQDPRLPQQIALDAASLIGDVIAGMQLTLLHAPAPAKFVLGDTPLPDADLAQGFTVPISSQVALLAEPLGPGQFGSLNVRQATSSEVAGINRMQYEMSRDVVIGPDPVVLDAL